MRIELYIVRSNNPITVYLLVGYVDDALSPFVYECGPHRIISHAIWNAQRTSCGRQCYAVRRSGVDENHECSNVQGEVDLRSLCHVQVPTPRRFTNISGTCRNFKNYPAQSIYSREFDPASWNAPTCAALIIWLAISCVEGASEREPRLLRSGIQRVIARHKKLTSTYS
jgi:hypothetical protein